MNNRSHFSVGGQDITLLWSITQGLYNSVGPLGSGPNHYEIHIDPTYHLTLPFRMLLSLSRSYLWYHLHFSDWTWWCHPKTCAIFVFFSVCVFAPYIIPLLIIWYLLLLLSLPNLRFTNVSYFSTKPVLTINQLLYSIESLHKKYRQLDPIWWILYTLFLLFTLFLFLCVLYLFQKFVSMCNYSTILGIAE